MESATKQFSEPHDHMVQTLRKNCQVSQHEHFSLQMSTMSQLCI